VERLKSWLVHILGVRDANEIPEMCTTYKQKIGLLPRLTESVSHRVIQNKLNGNVPDKRQCAPSETDWDIYLETLAVQNKSEEMLEALRGINCHPLVVDGEASSADDAIPQIHDEHTIENHVGTILPYTQRKKLEQMSEIALKLGKFDEAEGWYRELLGVFPDQWTYWMGLIDSCVIKSLDGVDEEGWKRCQTFANEIIAANDASRKHPALRGPHLFL
jgi:tetratricopeptide (TPR) repeat protein